MILKEMVEPRSPLVAVVLYHRIGWLSLSDCISCLGQLLPLLVRYFEEQAEDTHNHPAVQSNCRDLHVCVSMPRFHLYLFPESSFRPSCKNE